MWAAIRCEAWNKHLYAFYGDGVAPVGKCSHLYNTYKGDTGESAAGYY